MRVHRYSYIKMARDPYYILAHDATNLSIMPNVYAPINDAGFERNFHLVSHVCMYSIEEVGNRYLKQFHKNYLVTIARPFWRVRFASYQSSIA